MFNKGTKTTQWGKDSFFNKWHWKTVYPHAKKMKLDPNLTPYKKLTQSGLKI